MTQDLIRLDWSRRRALCATVVVTALGSAAYSAIADGDAGPCPYTVIEAGQAAVCGGFQLNKAVGGINFTDVGSCRQYVALGTARVGGAGALLNQQLTGGPPPFISRVIYYEICCNGAVTIDFGGSYFPSHRAYVGAPQGTFSLAIGERLQDNGRLGQFTFTRGVIAPTVFASYAE